MNDITEELINEGVQESKHFKRVINSKACKRYAKNAQDLSSCRLKIAELNDLISQKEDAILELKRQYYTAKDVDTKNEIAEKINAIIEQTSEPIKEYNRLLTEVYAPKVAAMKEDSKAIESHMREVKGLDYILPTEAIIGKTPKSPRDKNFRIIA